MDNQEDMPEAFYLANREDEAKSNNGSYKEAIAHRRATSQTPSERTRKNFYIRSNNNNNHEFDPRP